MQLTKIEKNGITCAIVNSSELVITDTQTALDVLMSAKYDIGTKNIVIDKKLIVEDFFILSRGLAGEILQKYVNYGGRIAIYAICIYCFNRSVWNIYIGSRQSVLDIC